MGSRRNLLLFTVFGCAAPCICIRQAEQVLVLKNYAVLKRVYLLSAGHMFSTHLDATGSCYLVSGWTKFLAARFFKWFDPSSSKNSDQEFWFR